VRLRVEQISNKQRGRGKEGVIGERGDMLGIPEIGVKRTPE